MKVTVQVPALAIYPEKPMAIAEPSPHIQRMLIERYDLFKKVLLLEAFIQENPVYDSLDAIDKELMANQLGAMKQYQKFLEQRIRKAEGSS